jgi:hypothetical protein
MEIIEGSSQIQEMMISKFGFQEYERHLLEQETVDSRVGISA